jgi:DNA-binding CsgD family transcriptional regulator
MVAPLTEVVDLASMGGNRAALILINEPDREDAFSLCMGLQQAFGLTPAEARTAALVGSGLAPQDVADQLGITVGTVRCELKSVFEKLAISRQSELAALVVRLAVFHPSTRNGVRQSEPCSPGLGAVPSQQE